QSKGSAAPSSSKTAASAEYQAWTMTDIRLRPSISLTPADLQMDEHMALDEQAYKPLPLGGPPGQVTIQSNFFFNKDLEYLRYGSKGSRPACFEYKHDYTVIDSPRAVTFRGRYGVQMIMHFNEIHKFSDGTLQQIDEALDYRVKEFKINRMNPGLNTRFWTKKDVDMSQEFMFAIQKRLNLESFIGGRVRDGDYRLLKRTE
nr:hypothetical protein [Tanacetum cinerariifolium]